MVRAVDGSRWARRAGAVVLLAAVAIAGAAARVEAADLQLHLLPDIAAQADLQIDIDLAIVQPAVVAVPYLGGVPLKVGLVHGPQPMKVKFAFERADGTGWQALGTYETGWNLVPIRVPGSFLTTAGSYRVRVAPLDSGAAQARRVVTPATYDWSPWREFRFQPGNSVPTGGVTKPTVKQPASVLQQ
jgi:hypothetical protein